jgi:hypothetical protein
VTGLSPQVLAELVAELGPRGQASRDARLADRPRRRAVRAGARHRLVLLDRLPATLVRLRHRGTHDVLACWLGVPRSTITPAIGEVRPLLAERGCTSRTAFGCTPWPMWSPIWAPAGSSVCSMPPRCGCAVRPPVGPVGAGSSRARPAPKTAQGAGPHRPCRAAAVLRTDPSRCHPPSDPGLPGRPGRAGSSRGSPCWLTPRIRAERADRRFRPQRIAGATAGRPVGRPPRSCGSGSV